MDDNAEKMAKKLFDKASTMKPEYDNPEDVMNLVGNSHRLSDDSKDQNILDMMTCLVQSIKDGNTQLFDGPDGNLYMKYGGLIFMVKDPHMEKFLRVVTDPY